MSRRAAQRREVEKRRGAMGKEVDDSDGIWRGGDTLIAMRCESRSSDLIKYRPERKQGSGKKKNNKKSNTIPRRNKQRKMKVAEKVRVRDR